jgi:1,4-dihydroxy-2-naphthoyl-CoA synthase
LLDLEKETNDLANMIAEKPPVATKMNKKWFKQLTEENFNKCMEFAIKAHIEGYKSGEPNEYQKRFFEIRAKRRAAKK